jgi:hypothetical protein
MRLYYKDQPVNAVQGNNRRCVMKMICNFSNLCLQFGVFVVKARGAYSYQNQRNSAVHS